MRRYLPHIGAALAIYVLSAGISFAVFSTLGTGRPGGPAIVSPISPDISPAGQDGLSGLPRTEACPLNGKLYSKPEREIWETRRPLSVMLENSTDARPHSGLSKADIVYEAVAEGGITRFLAIFYCGVAENTELAPVRSARTYYLDWVSEYDALYNHVGGAGRCSDPTVDTRAKALCQIGQYGIKDLDQFGISFPDCYRNPDRTGKPVATEHQMVCLSENLYDIAEERGWTNVDEEGVSWDEDFTPWKLKEEAPASDRGTVMTIDLYFWKGYEGYDVTWQYDKELNEYKRLTGGEIHKDLLTDTQLTAKNVVVQYTVETGSVDEHKHLLYKTIGGGEALIFMDGKAIEGSWSKKSRTNRTKYLDDKGKEISFNPGIVWVEIVPTGNTVTF